METHKPIRRMETHKPIFGPPLTDAFVALSAVPPPPCPQKPMLLTAEVNPPGHGVRHPPAEAYLKRLGRPNLFLLAAPSLDGDWRPWAALLTAPPGAPLRMRHRGRSPPAQRPEQACKEKPPVALCITPHPPGSGEVPSSNPGILKADNQLRLDDCHAVKSLILHNHYDFYNL